MYQKVLRLCRKTKNFYQNLNLFSSVPPSTDEHQLKNERISTQLYILLLLGSAIILLLYTSIITITQTINVEKPTFEQYSHLYSIHSQTLTCPCTKVSVNYGYFLQIQYQLHPICSSVFITDDWIARNDAIDQNLFINADFRITISYTFQALRTFCELIESTIYNSLIQFNSTQYITASVVSFALFQSETQSFVDLLRSSTTNNFLLSLNMTRKTIQGNAFLSAQLTNYNLHIINQLVTSTSVKYSDCDCHRSATCIKQLTFYNFTDNQTFFDVPGLYIGCYVIESLLQSNLQCFYNQTCIDQLQMYLSTNPPMNAQALNSSLSSQYYPNTTIENLLNNLMIEQWKSAQFYGQYYEECQPLQCSYTIDENKGFVYSITTMFGVFGGLITILRYIIPRFVKFVRKKRQRLLLSFSIICTCISHLFPTLKKFYRELNVFRSMPPSTNEHQLQNQRISTRLYLFFLIVLLTILFLYTCLINITQTIHMKKPTFEQYSQLNSTYSQSLTCPCQHISIDYGKILHIEYQLHQICSSFFISDQWISYIANSYGDTFVNMSFFWIGSNIFQSLGAFCDLIQHTISNDLTVFNSLQYITASVVPFDLFQSQTQSFIDQFKYSTTNNFLLSLITVRNISYGNSLLSGLLTNYGISAYDQSQVLSTLLSYLGCSCSQFSTCIKPAVVWNDNTNLGYFSVPGFYVGCYVIESLLQSNLRCFYDQQCLDQLDNCLTLPILRNITALDPSLPSQYYPNTTIENLLKNLMIEQWNSTQFYDQYYKECQPLECSYRIEARNSMIYIITTLFGIFGGLITVLRWIVPLVVKFIRKNKQRVRVRKARRIRIVLKKFKDICLNLNLFRSIPPSTDRYEVKTQQIVTRLFILSLILSSTILLLYTSLEHIDITINVERPTLQQYAQLHSRYSQSLTCPCQHISIDYRKILNIQYQFHQICSSFFISDQWISYITTTAIYHSGYFVTGDFRIMGSFQFLGLRSLCQLIEGAISNSLVEFNARQYITASVVSFDLFQSQTQSFIDQFKFSTTNNFLLSLNMTRKMIQGNILISGRQTNYKLHHYTEDMPAHLPFYDSNSIRVTSRIYDCNCALSMTCIDNSSLFNGVNNNRRAFNVTGFYVGCYTIESLLRSNLQCFYDQQCLNLLQYYSESYTTREIIALNSSLSSQYYPNTTIENLLKNLMIEQLNSTQFYDQYYEECDPIECHYRIETRNSMIYIITTLFGIIGGWTRISKILVPILIKIIIYFFGKWRNRVNRQIATSTS